jgi:putative ABC transport system ATP-binding protein
MLKLINISHRYEKGLENSWILENINYEFGKKKYVLIGQSGIGKTTLLNIAGSIIKPTVGEIESNFNLGFIFQSLNLLSDFSLRENIELPGKINSQETKYSELAKLTNIENILDKFPNEVSGGQKQRAAITRALASGANFIIADEPTANLDKANAKLIIDLFALIHERLGIGCLISTHDTTWLDIADEKLEIQNRQLKKR